MYTNGIIKKVVCKNCKAEFIQTRNQYFCSSVCYHQYVRDHPKEYRHVEYVALTCRTCAKIFERNKQQIRGNENYCSKKCAGTVTGAIRHMNGPRVKSTEKACEYCGKTIMTKGRRIIRFCSRACFNAHRSRNGWGDNNPNYKHGHNPGVAIGTAKRHFAMMCIVCDFDVVVAVHHIIPKHQGGNNAPSNLAVLCPNHHAMADRGLISQAELQSIVSKRLQTNSITLTKENLVISHAGPTDSE